MDEGKPAYAYIRIPRWESYEVRMGRVILYEANLRAVMGVPVAARPPNRAQKRAQKFRRKHERSV